MALYKVFGLAPEHVYVQTTLARPVKSKFRLDLHSMHERMAFLMNEYELDTIEFLLKLHSGNGAFLDIGANIGLISIPFAKRMTSVPGASKVYAIEAVSSNVSALNTNISLNELDTCIAVVPHGVGDTVKTVEIQVENNLTSRSGTGTANILPDDSEYQCERIPLTITTLDTLLAEGTLPDNVNLLKVDVDGYDLFAMRGARTLLTKTRPIVFGEFMAHCLNWHGQSLVDVVDFMKTLNYTTFMRCHPSWMFTTALAPDSYVQDLLIVPVERVNECRWCIQDPA